MKRADFFKIKYWNERSIKMEIAQFEITGGKRVFKLLTLKLYKRNVKCYESGKILSWLNMLNKGEKPKKWNKPNKYGTAVRFVTIKSQKEYDIALEELKEYIIKINQEHELGIELPFNEEEAIAI